MYRHGDVLIAEVAAIPKEARPKPHTILAKGEMTGHTHRIEPRDSVRLFEDGELLYLHVVAPNALVVHEEHAPIALPPGFYKVWQQREYTPQAIRRVVD